MKNLRKFNTLSEYEAATLSYPSVSYIVETNNCKFDRYAPPPIDYSKEYLQFEALESGTFKFSGNSINYSVDSGNTWTALASNTDSPTVASGETIMFKASGLTPTTNGIGRFRSTGQFKVKGNVMSLYYGDDFEDQTDLTGKNYAFRFLFSGCTGMTSAENLVLPATTLAESCYLQMFKGCSSLTTAPSLPATTLASSCYSNMFQGCTSLTVAPALSATTLADSCCNNMFSGCTSLTTAHELPATTLADKCYQYMFNGCTSLTTAPELPATKVLPYCYQYMFQGCTSLTTAPALPATTLKTRCYSNMFQGCTSLTVAPALSATTLADSCCNNMFIGCTSLTTAPELPATTLANNCYAAMFQGCTRLNYIKCLATDISAYNSILNWVSGVSSTGTFVKAASMTGWTTGVNGIPNNWTVQDA